MVYYFIFDKKYKNSKEKKYLKILKKKKNIKGKKKK